MPLATKSEVVSPRRPLIRLQSRAVVRAPTLANAWDRAKYWKLVVTTMPRLVRFSLLALLLGGFSGTGCGPGGTNGTAVDGDGGNGNGGNGGASASGNAAGMAGRVPINTINCGDGLLNMGEYCDDHNLAPGDGCSPSCQIEADWECTTPGAPCVRRSACGDGVLGATEQCDDMNTVAGDGCSADCLMVEMGFLCRVPGKRCSPFCGDGQLVGGENCDDNNSVSMDGCSATCLVEPGSSCMGTPSVCTVSECGNAVEEAGESCDFGRTPDTMGRVNGLFNGDASGCSKTCTQEPSCRDGATTRACSAVCGDANKDMGEDCDDGNAVANDGCSATCTIEPGFTCTDMARPDTETCAAGECLRMPVVFRDFDGQNLSSGHPDFFFLGPVEGRRCIPNASGRPVVMNGTCWDSDSTPLCPGVAAATLGANGKPTLGATTSCPCRFTDWDNTGILQGATTGTLSSCNAGAAAPQRIEMMARVVQSAQSFAQWYTDSALGTKAVDFIELAPGATAMQYRFSSSGGRTVYQDIHDIFMNLPIPATNGAPANSLSSGFFPLEARTGAHATKLCNLWPYWPTALTTANCVAQDGNPVWQQWDPQGSGTRGVAGMGEGGRVVPVTGVPRNFYFTSEVRYLFRYAGGETLAFNGDDDVWVFINGKLVLDLGAPHERLEGTVTLNADSATWTIQTLNIATNTPIPIANGTVTGLGLEVGRTHEIVVFHADRHPRESNYQLTLSGFATQRSACEPRCGDGVVAAAEECDDGPNNMNGVYGGCTTECRFGPFCGDGMPDTPDEECDQGRMNGAGYNQVNGCTAGCRFAPRCGDGIVHGLYNEQCDAGAANGPTGECRSDCTLPPR
jgi:fibro-slime domain-containing protein